MADLLGLKPDSENDKSFVFFLTSFLAKGDSTLFVESCCLFSNLHHHQLTTDSCLIN